MHHSRLYRITMVLTLAMLLASASMPGAAPRALAAAAAPAAPATDSAVASGSSAPAPFASTSAMAAAAAATGWVFQGPAPQLNAQQDTVNVPQAQESVSGAVTAIAASPTNPDLVYLGTANGGVWKSINATAATPTWAPLTDNLKGLSIGIGAVTLDPTDATGQTVVAGTGRYSGYANRGDDLVGLYYSTNGGASWTTTTSSLLSAARITGVAARGNTLLAASELGLYRSTTGPLGTWAQISGTGGLPSARAASIVGDPANPSRLYATFVGASGGIFRSDDLGATWTNITSGISVISASTTAFNAAVFNNGTTSVVTVVLNGTVAGVAGIAIFRSVNGAPFTALDAPGQFTHAYDNFTITADKTNPDITYVAGGYIIVASGPFLSAVNRLDASKPSGSQLTLLYGGVSTTLSAAVTNTATTLTVASTSGMPTTLPFVLTVDSEQMSVTAVAGTTLTVTRGANGTTAAAHALSATVSGYPTYGAPHVDVNYLLVDGGGGLLLGTHGSLYRLQDPANPPSSTNYWAAKNGNLGIGEMHDVGYDSIAKVLIGSNQDNIVVYQSATGSQTWAAGPFFSGDGGDVAVDTTTLANVPSTTLAAAVTTTTGTSISVASAAGFPLGLQFLITVDSEQMLITGITGTTLTVTRGANGTTKATHTAGATVSIPPQSIRYGSNQTLGSFRRQVYTAANVMVSNVAISYAVITDGQFTTPLALNAVDAKRMLIGGSLNLYETLDFGNTIANIATVGSNSAPGPIAYGGFRNGVANPDVIYAGKGGTIYSRSAAGAALTAVAALPAGVSTLRRIVLNPADWMNAFAMDSDQVFQTTNGGTSWSDVTGGLLTASSAEFMALTFVGGPTPYIAVGTRSGVFASPLSNLGTWVQLGSGLPDVLVFELAYNATDDVLVAGTLGRAAWMLPTASSAFVPTSVAPVLALSGATTATEHGTYQNSYTFTVNDPGDRFTVAGPTITGGQLVAGSLTTTGSGGSFKVIFPDGPATASISLQVTDSTGLASNVAAVSVAVANAAPVATILGAPTSGSPGVAISLTSSVTDQSAVDQAAGFIYDWLVQKTVGTTVTNFATGSAANFTYTPDVAGTYKVFLRAKDKDGVFSGYTAKTITAASPNLTEDAVSLTIGEGMAAVNGGSYSHHGPAPLALSASVGTIEQTQNPRFTNITSISVPGSATPWDSAANPAFTIQQISSPGPVVISSINGSSIAGGTPVRLTYLAGGIDLGGGGSFDANGAAGQPLGGSGSIVYAGGYVAGPTPNIGALIGAFTNSAGAIVGQPFTVGNGPTSVVAPAGASQLQLGVNDGNYGDNSGTWTIEVATDSALNVLGYWQLGEDDAGAADGVAGNATTSGQDSAGLSSAIDLPRSGNPSYTAVDGANGSVLAMAFDGSDGYGGTTPVTTIVDNFGIEAWVKPASTTGLQMIAHNGVFGSDNGFGLMINNGNYYGEYGLNVARAFDTGVAVTINTWTHIAMVRDGGITRIYIDGSLVHTNSSVVPAAAGNGLSIGKRPLLASGFFNGAIDDVRIFSFAPGAFNTQDLAINTSISGSWSWNYTPADNAPTADVVITATTGVSGDATHLPFPLTVDNSAPTAALSNSGPVSEGSTATVSFSGQSDPSAADTSAGFHYAYDFDNDGVFDLGGDGTYANAVTAASATVPASALAEGPSTQLVLARIIDKDGGYTDSTASITINNGAPTATIDGPGNLLVSQVGTFIFKATDPSASDQAAGFSYSVDWGDGSSETIAPVIGSGDATVRHAYASTGSKSIQVTATDKDGTASASVSASVTVSAMTSANLQATIADTPVVYLQPASDAALHTAVSAINSLSAPASEANITITLGAGPYTGVTLSPPSGVILALAGSYTADDLPGMTKIASASGPAVTVSGGEVFVQGNGLATAANAPTVLVTGGHLILGQSKVQESTGANNVAVAVTGGSANFGFDLVLNINGAGGFVSSYARSALVPHPEGIDAELNPNLFQQDGITVHASYLSSTSLASTLSPSFLGQPVTLTATISVNDAEHGPASGTVTFYDGTTALGSGAVSKVGGAFVASLTTSALGIGSHTLMAAYSGDQGYVASSATLTQAVVNRAPVAANDSYATNRNTALTIAAPGLLANDTDADGNALTAVKVTNPAHGTVTVNANGSFTYTPATGYSGTDSFTYKANDGADDSNVATVTITVNAPPVANADSYSTLANTALTVAAPGLLANDTDADGDPLTAIKVTNPARGTVTVNANGSLTYTPAAGFVGSDSFTYKANDGKADSAVATVTISVRYNFTGFFGTVLNPPTLNQSNAGQNIAFLFSLGGNFGLNVFAAGAPLSQQINCTTGALIGTAAAVSPAANFSYNATTGRYTYTAKTDKAWVNTCRRFNLRLADGTDHFALFRFK